MTDHTRAKERYRKHRLHTRELLEEAAFHEFRYRVDVGCIDEDILRRAQRDWYGHPLRKCHWEWDEAIMGPLRRSGSRWLDLALLVRGQLCGLVAARLSPNKTWLSLTHIEASPDPEHPLKGAILPLAIQALYLYRGVIHPMGEAKKTGIRILHPLEEALPCYRSNGYTLQPGSKWLRAIVLEAPEGDQS